MLRVTLGVPGVVEGVPCVAAGVPGVTFGFPVVMAPPGAVVVCPELGTVPVVVPGVGVPVVPVVCAAATPMASANAKPANKFLRIESTPPNSPTAVFPLESGVFLNLPWSLRCLPGVGEMADQHSVNSS